MVVNKKRLAGIAVSVGLFAIFGFVTAIVTVAFTGVSMTEPFTALSTGPTPIHIGEDVLAPFGVSPTEVGLPAEAAIILPGVPVDISALGFTLSFKGFTIADVFGGIGASIGFIVGAYYYLLFTYEDYKGASSDEPSSSD